jgi:hypothetical protein
MYYTGEKIGGQLRDAYAEATDIPFLDSHHRYSS